MSNTISNKTATIKSLNDTQISFWGNIIGQLVIVGKQFVHSVGTDVEIWLPNGNRLLIDKTRLTFEEE